MHRMKVGVLRGGPSSEYDVSLKSGASVLRNLNEEKYIPVDVLIDRAGVWHARGLPLEPRRVLQGLDVAINAMHGEYGEDGVVQRILEASGVPYTGTRVLGAALAMNKLTAKKCLSGLEIRLPRHTIVNSDADLEEVAVRIFNTMSQPVVVKPVSSGSSVGVSIVHGAQTTAKALEEALGISSQALVEEFISGREATCGVLEHFRGEDVYALPPIEIIPPKGNTFFDYDAKYSGKSQEVCPSSFSSETKRALEDLARQVHRTLGLRHYSRSDFIVTPRRGIYFLEVNTLPGLTSESLYPKATAAVGCSFPQLLDHLIWLARERK
jgi:D-alanine-D-alanine ligase